MINRLHDMMTEGGRWWDANTLIALSASSVCRLRRRSNFYWRNGKVNRLKKVHLFIYLHRCLQRR